MHPFWIALLATLALAGSSASAPLHASPLHASPQTAASLRKAVLDCAGESLAESLAALDGVTSGPQAIGKEAEKKRILHLESGQTIRVLSRWVDDHWEYKNKSGWKALDAHAVASVVLETDVLGEWNALRDAANPKKVEDRVRLANWAATSGLMKESLEEIDAALRIAPDDAAALDVLAKNWFFSVPTIQVTPDKLGEAAEELLRFGASMTAAGRELAAIELARHPNREALHARVAKELRSQIPTRRTFAALALRRIFPGEDIKPLILHAVLDPSEDVRLGCALALHAANEPGVCVPIVRAMLEGKSGLVRANAAQALGNMGYPAAVEPLIARLAAGPTAPSGGDSSRSPHSYIFVGSQIAYVQDFDVQVAQFQAAADPQVNTLIEGAVLDVAVASSVDVSFTTESVMVRVALEKLTREMPGHLSKDWLAWWEKNGAKWRSADLSKPKTG